MTTPPIYLKQLELGPMQNFIYLIGDPETREAAVVDPGWEVPQILEAAAHDGYRLTKAFVTHHHFDHTQGLPDLLKAVDLPIYVHQHDAPHLGIPSSHAKLLCGGEAIKIGNREVTMIHTPGHTPGSQCLLVEGRLLSGDTLFIGACGRSDLPGGDPKQLYDTLSRRLRPLDDRTVLCPGHNYGSVPTTPLGEEKRTNPYLASPTLHEFLQLVGYA
jgi:glyoxylase-like metal-dependent hydrolase (beta-lactamase superfamily II)